MTISATPSARTPAGSVASSCGSASTASGRQNAPTSFLAITLIPVLPPIDASTWPTSVVGSAIHGRPRRNVAAARPPASVIEPPPAQTTTVARVASASASPRQSRSSDATVLAASPPSTRIVAACPCGMRSATAGSAISTERRPASTSGSRLLAPSRTQTDWASAAAAWSGSAVASTIAEAVAA